MCCGRPSKQKKRVASKFVHLKPRKGAFLAAQSTPLKTFLMCRPTFFGVEYEINPWMKLSSTVDKNKALEQWNNLSDRIKEHGGAVINIKPREGLPDMVFTANAGLYLKESNTLCLSSFLHDQRQKEQWWFYDFFIERKTTVVVNPSVFEGAGDALFLGETLIGGHGFRSHRDIYAEIRPLLEHEPKVVKLKDPSFYHLDTCFCPLDGMDYMIYPGAFNDQGLADIRSLGGTEISVSKEEARKFACNAVCIGKTVILPTGCDNTYQALESKGYKPVPVDMSEFMKSGGAAKCLTLAI